MKRNILTFVLVASTYFAIGQPLKRGRILKKNLSTPNVILIYVDDLGYGDLSCYGAKKIHTPNIDRLAGKGVQFMNGHCTSATSTPSRYALMTGLYPWRKSAEILPGDAALIVPTDKLTLPKVFQRAGYTTGIVGKWHLGLGKEVEKNWNDAVKPGPNEVGFDYSFIFPATADRVPTVFMQNGRIVSLDIADPVSVDYVKKIGNDPTGAEHPELLKMKSSPGQGHDQTIVNGIGRIGYMSGGNKARWVDEEVPLTFLAKAQEFISNNADNPFFLFYTMTEPHVPRMPSTMFKGKSGLGYRGDAILQMDWSVGEVMKQLEQLGIEDNTIVIFSSDNGPVLDDGYQDEAVTRLNGHKPSGTLRGGKYSAFEAGTRVPFIIKWPSLQGHKVSDALVCQIDFLASFAKLLNVDIDHAKYDSEDMLNSFLARDVRGRRSLVKQGGALSITVGNWKYIDPSQLPAMNELTNTELGNYPAPQLYDLKKDLSERTNLAGKFGDKVRQLQKELDTVKKNK